MLSFTKAAWALVVTSTLVACAVDADPIEAPPETKPAEATTGVVTGDGGGIADHEVTLDGGPAPGEDASAPTGPSNVEPTDRAELTDVAAKASVTFRWTPIVPKPKEPVTYRLKVWQLMQGQTGAAAMKESAPVVTKDVTDATEATVTDVYTGPCRPPYLCDFVWSVAAAASGATLGEPSAPTTFTVVEHTGPANLAPKKDASLPDHEAAKGVTFRWTPIVPKPKDPVTYRLKVWQLMQGQDGASAIKDGTPIVTKDLTDLTETTVTEVYTGPCRPPYLCDFVWSVAMVGPGALGEPSAPTGFSVIETKGPTNVSPSDEATLDGKTALAGVTFEWTPVAPKPADPVTYRVRVWQMMQGAGGTPPAKSEKPVLTRQVTDATAVEVVDLYTGPCKPPYLCDFVWSVDAALAGGTVLGEPSPATTFSIK